MELLRFQRGNAKLDKSIYTFSLPSGHTCPGANECLSKADKKTGKLTDGPNNKFRCFSATQENIWQVVRASRWHNFNLLKKTKSYNNLIIDSIPQKADIIRIHVAGDFFNQQYFESWIYAAIRNLNKKFYFYTKSLNYWINNLKTIGTGYNPGVLTNFIPTASRGGRYDNLIIKHGLREAKVVFSEDEAKEQELEIDHDDSHAMTHGPDFALLLHGIQPAGSEAAKAYQKLKMNGKAGYSRKPLKTL